ncbi:unnamed protein product [Moneuplotes crassus]|uniref:Uncharacterized protein n=1 Tax=Euplotes crassus TaxID=5936 RepID=A0AAD1XMB5_EUPCR|nr:unnamed protein product [Moneuplotes crassus]
MKLDLKIPSLIISDLKSSECITLALCPCFRYSGFVNTSLLMHLLFENLNPKSWKTLYIPFNTNIRLHICMRRSFSQFFANKLVIEYGKIDIFNNAINLVKLTNQGKYTNLYCV